MKASEYSGQPAPLALSALCEANSVTLWDCGQVVEVTIMRKGANIVSGMPCRPGGATVQKEAETKESIQARSAARAKRRIRRLVNANGLDVMVTLTFSPPGSLKARKGEKWRYSTIDQQKDRAFVLSCWKEFVAEHARRRGKSWPYVAVLELHTGKRAGRETVKTGTYHVHFVTSRGAGFFAPEHYKKLVQTDWQRGLCDVKDLSLRRSKKGKGEAVPGNAGVYMSKYFDDKGDMEKGRGVNERRYFSSRGLQKPRRMNAEEEGSLNAVLEWQHAVEVDGRVVMMCQTWRKV